MLLTAALLSLPAVLAQYDPAQLELSTYPYLFSHLSPLITYAPADAWTHNGWSSNATAANATATFQAQGSMLIVNGRQVGASWSAEPEYTARFSSFADGWSEGDQPSSEMLRESQGGDGTLRTLTLTSGSVEGDGGLEVQRVQQFTNLPGVSGHRDERILRQSAVRDNGDANTFFTSTPNAWSTANSTARLSRYNGSITDIPSVWYTDRFTPPFETNSTLRTTTPNEPLRFAVPQYTSFLQWYGTVGPEFGEFELRVLPLSPVSNATFPWDRRSYKASAERSVESGLELMMVAYLDPRVQYNAEVVLLQEGKSLDVSGMFFSTYVTDTGRLGPGNFVQEWVDRRGGAGRAGASKVAVVAAIALAFAVMFS